MDAKNTLPKVAFIVGEFPDSIGTFIIDEINGIIDLGVDLEVFSIRRSKKSGADQYWDSFKHKERVHFLNIHEKEHVRAFKAFPLILKNIFIHPIIILKSLKRS